MSKNFPLLIFESLMVPLFIWAIGLLWFIMQIPTATVNTVNLKADGIITFTGGQSRIKQSLNLLTEGVSNKLLISGIVDEITFRKTYKINSSMMLKVTLGYAHNTSQNAWEAKIWSDLNNIETILLVTSNYHMPRSLLEIKKILPNKVIIPYPVFTNNFSLKNGWKSYSTIKILIMEYHKYLALQYRIMTGARIY